MQYFMGLAEFRSNYLLIWLIFFSLFLNACFSLFSFFFLNFPVFWFYIPLREFLDIVTVLYLPDFWHIKKTEGKILEYVELLISLKTPSRRLTGLLVFQDLRNVNKNLSLKCLDLVNFKPFHGAQHTTFFCFFYINLSIPSAVPVVSYLHHLQ